MMDIQMPYGKNKITIRSRRGDQYKVISKIGHSSVNTGRLIRQRINNPVSPITFSEYGEKGDSVAIVINDYTRPTDTKTFLPVIISKLRENGIENGDISIVLGLGLHRPATEEEIVQLVGRDLYKQIKVINHDPDRHLKNIGEISINKTVAEASLVILTGAVTFHPMAGFSGGFKSILPGIASREDIIKNHYLYFKGLEAEYNIGSANIKKNPVLNDIQKRSRLNKDILALNVVMGENKEVIEAAFGFVEDVWNYCVNFLKKNYMVHISNLYPLVISSAGGFPSDISFYQCMKVLNNSARACKKGGKIVILAECKEGWELRKKLLEYFSLSTEEIIAKIKNNFSMDSLAVFMAFRIIKNYRVYFYSSLPDEEVKMTGMIPLNTVEQIQVLMNNCSEKISIIPRASYILPDLKKDQNYDLERKIENEKC